jgi:AmiR/NasT family two-component response regulator
LRVLVVDESAEHTEKLHESLRQAGWEVAASLSSPLGLLAALDEHRPDVIVVDVASVRAILAQLADATLRLDERKLVERAKGILMKARGLGEEDAYRALRRMAMDRSRRIGEVARNVIEMAELLG